MSEKAIQTQNGIETGTAWRSYGLRLSSVLSLVIFFKIILLWEYSVDAWDLPVYMLPAPSQIFFALLNGLDLDNFWGAERFYIHIWVTLIEAALGFLIGAAAGIAFGGVVSQAPILESIVKPYIMGFQSLPKVAVAPLIVIWFGFGISSKVVLIALMVFFPLMINSIAGFKSVDLDLHELMRSLSASRWQVFRSIQVPASLPYIFAGLEMGVVYSFIGAVVGEFVGGNEGLGVLILQLNAAMDVAGMFAVLLLLAAMGAGAAKILQHIRRRVLYWAPSEQSRDL